MEELKACPICSETTLAHYADVKDYSISKETFKLVSCVHCGFVFTNPRPLEKDLSKYYESEEYISHSGTKKGLINKLYHQVQSINLNLKFRSISKLVPRGTWADFGAGNGAFLSFLKDKNIEAIGFEPDESARNLGIEKGANILDASAYPTYDKPLSAVTMWHVLEHVPDLKNNIQLHHSKLVKDGILCIAVPNYQSFDGKYYKEQWAALDVPRHLWHFTEENILRLVTPIGFEHIKTKGMPFDSYYISMLSEKYKNRSSMRGVILGALSNFYARVSGYPFSSQIYIFKKK